MLRMSKLTDYGIVLLTHLAHKPGASFTARELAMKSGVPLPTVGKLLKTLSRGEILKSQRGINGGYKLTHTPQNISVARIITLLEGPVAITDCSNTKLPGACDLESHCPVKSNWRIINSVVQQALEGLTLADMVQLPGRKVV